VTTYPPEQHVLRDLRLTFDVGGDGTSRAWMPVVPEICGDDGAVRAGALTTLVDVIGGGLAASTVQPNWIATADLTLHVTAAATAGTVGAEARVLRAGRTTVVIEVELVNDERPVGLATMSFAVLPRRDTNPDLEAARPSGPSTMATDTSGFTAPLFDMVGIEVVDAAAGVVELPVREWATNTMGALQGGLVGAVVEAAGTAALRRATGRPLVATDLQVTYLSFGRVGPLRTDATVLTADTERGVARVRLLDLGAESRHMCTARVVATRSLA
jgi:uncharacterized protein (TIGR00369 family)